VEETQVNPIKATKKIQLRQKSKLSFPTGVCGKIWSPTNQLGKEMLFLNKLQIKDFLYNHLSFKTLLISYFSHQDSHIFFYPVLT